jgi:hypothetical protein
MELLRGEEVLAEVERVLDSNTFRNSDALRRLLKFLAERMLAGDADQLKEYTVGIDALGKPPTYDPRHDSTVRIQVGRLRLKLADYYHKEAENSRLIIDLPKGRFKLTCEERLPVVATTVVSAQSREEAAQVPAATPARRIEVWRNAAIALSLVLVITCVLGGVAYWRLWSSLESTSMFRAMWTPELEQLWEPFLAAKRPLIVSIADPPFVQFKGYGAYRDLTLNTWEDIIKNPAVVAISKALGNPPIQHNAYYAPVGEVSASFLIGKLLGPRVPALSLLQTSELTMQQLANNSVLYIGAPIFFSDKLQGLPVKLDLDNSRPGIHNLHPHAGEPTLLSDTIPTGSSEDGEAYALVTHVSGPLGTSEVESFTSNRTPGRLAAVQWLTDPAMARTLVSKIRRSSGEIPRHYQVVLKVKYKAGVPTETSYVFHHELQ